MTQSPSLAMSLQMGLEVECLLFLNNPPSSSNPGTEQRTIHEYIAEEFNAYMEEASSGELPFPNLSPLGPFDRNILSQCTCVMFFPVNVDSNFNSLSCSRDNFTYPPE